MLKRKAQSYEIFYERISNPFREQKSLLGAMKTANLLLTYTTAVTYILMLAWLFFRRDSRFLPVTLLPAIGFLLLSLVRKLINRKRPYEAHKIDPLIKKDTKGKSMPSRHVFSMTVIAFAIMQVSLPVGICFALFSLLLGLIRVVGGVHYPEDVAVGYLCGCFMGSLIFLLVR